MCRKRLSVRLELSGRIAPILADGARGNPRQIKRFINTMMLRLAIAEERGFRDALNISVLAKIMLAERFGAGTIRRHSTGIGKHRGVRRAQRA